MKGYLQNEKGFTLVELLIVVIILGILAAVAIPQFGTSTDDAREQSLRTNLATLRNAAELYYAEHGVYPGRLNANGDGNVANQAGADGGFITQLTQYTNAAGEVTTTLNRATHPYGPYFKKQELPPNPFVTTPANQPLVNCVINSTVLGLAGDGVAGRGWKFNTQTGELIANDGGHDSD